MKPKRTADCHRLRKHHALGLCRQCYQRIQRGHRSGRPVDIEKLKARNEVDFVRFPCPVCPSGRPRLDCVGCAGFGHILARKNDRPQPRLVRRPPKPRLRLVRRFSIYGIAATR
jgi:hypothetical protein